MVRGLWIFSTLATLLGAREIFAQEKQAEEVITLQPITVTATPLEAEQQHIAQPVEVLRGEDDALFYGAEFESIVQLIKNPAYGDLDARLFTDYVRGKLTRGDNLPRITPLRFGGGLDYRLGAWRGDFEIMRVADQDDNAPLETETDGYTLVELGVSYTLGSKPADLILALRGTNLLDEEAIRHTSFLKDVAPLLGRSATLTLRATF